MRAARAGADAARRALARAGARAGPSPASPRVTSLARPMRRVDETYATWAVSAGNGDFGRLGHGPSGSGDNALGLSSARFQVVKLPVDAVAASAGGAHTVLVGKDGAVYTCGLNDFGQLGHSFGAAKFVATPTKVEGLPTHDPVVAAAAGHFHTLCLTLSGEVWAFGKNDVSQCGLGAANAEHPSMAPSMAPTPRWLSSLSPDAPGGDDRGPVVFVAAGARHSIAVTANGAVYTWGADFEGCLGHGGETFRDDASETKTNAASTEKSFLASAYESLARFASRGATRGNSPRLIRSLADTGVKATSASCGDAHSLVLDDTGTVHAFGQGRFNQLGAGAEKNVAWLETPTPISFQQGELSGSVVDCVSAGGNFNVAVTSDGRLLSWGANGNGECGGGAEDDGRRDRPRFVKRPPPDLKTNRHFQFASASAGWRHAAATTRCGKLFAWGWGGSAGQHWEDKFTTGGQLGLGDGQVDFWEPTRVPSIGSVGKPRAISVSCGFNHTVVLVSDDG